MKKQQNSPIAIIMGRNYTSRLTMTRAAGKAGCKVVIIQTTRRKSKVEKIDASSKYAIATLHAIEPDMEDLLQKIERYKNADAPVILIPTDDYTASTIDLNMDRLKDYFLMPHVNHQQGLLVKVMDKDFQKTLAINAGLNVAKGWVSEFKDGRYIIPSDVSYPCFTKPQSSYMRALKDCMKKCNDEVELVNILNHIATKYNYREPILIEEFICIEKEYGVLGVSLEGKPIIPAIIHKTNEHLGVTATGIVSPIDTKEGLQVKLCAMVSSTNLTGLFDIDLYESNGKLYFNEMNLRFGAGGYAVIHAAVNLPEIFVNYLTKATLPATTNYQFQQKSFASEKVCAQKLFAKIGQNWTYEEYNKQLSSCDFTFLNQDYDIEPYKEFNKQLKIIRLKVGIKRFIDFIRKKVKI